MKFYKAIYKVRFKGINEDLDMDNDLTFYLEQDPFPLRDFSSFLFKFEEAESVLPFFKMKSIEAVEFLGSSPENEINSFFIILAKLKIEEIELNKIGFLIGNHPQKGFILLGYWPLILENKKFHENLEINEFLANILDDSTKFEEVLLLTSD